MPRWPQSLPQLPLVPTTQTPAQALFPGIILTPEGTSGGEVPGHVARLVTIQIPDPQALPQPFPDLPQGMSIGGSEVWPIGAEEGPRGSPLTLPRKAGAQRDE